MEEGFDTSDVTPETDAPDEGVQDQEHDGGESVVEESETDGEGAPQGKAKAKPQAKEDDGTEEIKIGSIKAKVPKELAQAVKNLERGFHMKAQELAKEKQKEAQRAQLKEQVKANPALVKRILTEEFGVDPEEFSEMTLREKLEMLEMTPEQRKLRELEEKNKTYEEKEREREEKAKKDREDREVGQIRQALDKAITDAWKDSGLPPEPFYVKMIAATVKDSIHYVRQGKLEKPLTPKQAATIVKRNWENSNRNVIHGLDPKGIYDLLGEEKFNQLREWDLKRVTSKAPGSQSHRPGSAPASSETKKKTGPVDDREYRRYWET